MLSLSHRFLFVHVPKTGGNSIQRALLPFSEDEIVLKAPHQDGVDRFEIRSPTIDMHKHLELAKYKARLPDEVFGELFKFCTIRNPWDRCVSYFFSPHRGEVEWSTDNFENFVRQGIRTACSYVRLSDGGEDPFANVDAVLRFEHLEDDFASIYDRVGMPAPRLPRVNVGAHRDYRSYYSSPTLIDCVNDVFSFEIRRFGYEFE